MKRIAAISLVAALAACTPQEPMEMSAARQSELAEELRGRTAGEPMRCVNTRTLGGNRSVGEGAIVFGSGGVVYVNRPPEGCPELHAGRALQTRTTSTQLCRGDIATVVDPVSGTHFGGCSLGDFTPYRRVR